jgi:hypothetical protein
LNGGPNLVSAYSALYVATRPRFLGEAVESLRSLWRHEPSMPVTMYIDPRDRARLRGWGIPEPLHPDLLDIVDHPEPTHSWADKPRALIDHTPLRERALLLDSDTRVCDAIRDVFALLDAFELAAAHAPVRLGPGQPASIRTRAPAAFPELNTGVLAYRKTSGVADLFTRWWSLHEEVLRSGTHRGIGDQATFRVALYESNVRFAVLPTEFNCRFTIPTSVQGRVRILHGRAPDLERVEREINAFTGARVFVPGLGVVRAPEKERGQAPSA